MNKLIKRSTGILLALLMIVFAAAITAMALDDDEPPETGFGQENGSWYYYENGKIDTDRNDVIQGTVDEQDGWWYVVGGQVQLNYTGLANYANDYGWWYIKNGQVDFSHNGVDQNDYGLWYVTDGKVQFGYTGVSDYASDSGWWYIQNGKVDQTKNSVEQNAYGWWYVLNGKVDFSYTGVSNYANDYGWWYIKDGKVDFSFNGLEQNNFGWWYIKNGKVDFSHNGVDENAYGWWYVTGGKVDFGYTGVANYANDYGWWYIKNGQVDFSHNGVDPNDYGWWYVIGAKVDFGYTGVANYGNDYGWWYIKDGKVDFSKNGVEQNAYGWWYVTGGQVQFGYTGVADYANDYGWWYIAGGQVDFSFHGVASNSYGKWYLQSGKVDFSYSGSPSLGGKTHTIRDGKVTSSLSWYQVDTKIYHAGGGYQGVTYTNSVDALQNSLSLNRKLIELDFVFTSDGKLVCQHEWDGAVPTYNEFMSGTSIGGFTPMDAEEAVTMMAAYDDTYLLVDAKGDDIDLAAVYRELYNICIQTGHPEFLDRIVAQIYYESEYQPVKDVYNFPNWVYYQYKQNITSVSGLRTMASFCASHGIETISIHNSLATTDRLNAIFSYGCVVTAWTVNSTDTYNKLINMGVSCICTDFL